MLALFTLQLAKAAFDSRLAILKMRTNLYSANDVRKEAGGSNPIAILFILKS